MMHLDPASIAYASRRARLRATDSNPNAALQIGTQIARSGESCKTNPNVLQLAKRSGALRLCALWRAARAGPKIRRMQNFLRWE
jgi:hypothetical protein